MFKKTLTGLALVATLACAYGQERVIDRHGYWEVSYGGSNGCTATTRQGHDLSYVFIPRDDGTEERIAFKYNGEAEIDLGDEALVVITAYDFRENVKYFASSQAKKIQKDGFAFYLFLDITKSDAFRLVTHDHIILEFANKSKKFTFNTYGAERAVKRCRKLVN